MKLTEGYLKRTFEEVAKEYPDIESWHIIVDNCCHQLVKKPEQFDVMVTTNMFGDILSDEGATIAGGVGMAPGANLNPDRTFPSARAEAAPAFTETLPVGAVRDSNGPMLGALIEAARFDFAGRWVCGDNLEETCRVLEQAASRADLVVTSGGVSGNPLAPITHTRLGRSRNPLGRGPPRQPWCRPRCWRPARSKRAAAKTGRDLPRRSRRCREQGATPTVPQSSGRWSTRRAA